MAKSSATKRNASDAFGDDGPFRSADAALGDLLEVEIVCAKCQAQSVDKNPVWSKEKAHSYVTKLGCSSCVTKSERSNSVQWPVDKDLRANATNKRNQLRAYNKAKKVKL